MNKVQEFKLTASNNDTSSTFNYIESIIEDLKRPQAHRLRMWVVQYLEDHKDEEQVWEFCKSLNINDISRLSLVTLDEAVDGYVQTLIEPEIFESQPLVSIEGCTFSSKNNITTQPVHYALLKNVSVSANSSMIFLPSGKVYQEHLDSKFGESIRLRDRGGLASSNSSVIVDKSVYQESHPRELKEAIFMLGHGSKEFGHWHLDLLTRWQGYEFKELPANIPILIDADMPNSHKEALKLLAPGFPIIELQKKLQVKVETLHFSTRPNFLPVQVKESSKISKDDCYIAPASISFLRKKFVDNHSDLDVSSQSCYVNRISAKHQNLINATDVERVFVSSGYKSTDPAALGFSDQVKLFSGATRIAGPMGSSMDHIIYLPKDTKCLLMSPPKSGSFSNFLGAMGRGASNTRFIFGDVDSSSGNDHHSSYLVAIENLENGLEWLES